VPTWRSALSRGCRAGAGGTAARRSRHGHFVGISRWSEFRARRSATRAAIPSCNSADDAARAGLDDGSAMAATIARRRVQGRPDTVIRGRQHVKRRLRRRVCKRTGEVFVGSGKGERKRTREKMRLRVLKRKGAAGERCGGRGEEGREERKKGNSRFGEDWWRRGVCVL